MSVDFAPGTSERGGEGMFFRSSVSEGGSHYGACDVLKTLK